MYRVGIEELAVGRTPGAEPAALQRVFLGVRLKPRCILVARSTRTGIWILRVRPHQCARGLSWRLLVPVAGTGRAATAARGRCCGVAARCVSSPVIHTRSAGPVRGDIETTSGTTQSCTTRNRAVLRLLHCGQKHLWKRVCDAAGAPHYSQSSRRKNWGQSCLRFH